MPERPEKHQKCWSSNGFLTGILLNGTDNKLTGAYSREVHYSNCFVFSPPQVTLEDLHLLPKLHKDYEVVFDLYEKENQERNEVLIKRNY